MVCADNLNLNIIINPQLSPYLTWARRLGGGGGGDAQQPVHEAAHCADDGRGAGGGHPQQVQPLQPHIFTLIIPGTGKPLRPRLRMLGDLVVQHVGGQHHQPAQEPLLALSLRSGHGRGVGGAHQEEDTCQPINLILSGYILGYCLSFNFGNIVLESRCVSKGWRSIYLIWVMMQSAIRNDASLTPFTLSFKCTQFKHQELS